MRKPWGYPSKEPCRICGKHDNNQSEPRFGYTCCEVHKSIPPAYLDNARWQYEAMGFTDWDVKDDERSLS